MLPNDKRIKCTSWKKSNLKLRKLNRKQESVIPSAKRKKNGRKEMDKQTAKTEKKTKQTKNKEQNKET